MSLLSQVYDGGMTRLSAADIADQRGLQLPFLSKVLTALVQANLIEASRGPGGGFTLTKPPKDIVLFDVFSLFERESQQDLCPFGGGICGEGEKCPLHDRFADVHVTIDEILHKTTFAEFQSASE